jgi:hypothetical protein
MARALTTPKSGEAQTDRLRAEIRGASEHLDELTDAYAQRLVTMQEWSRAKKPIEARKIAAERKLLRLTNNDYLVGLIGAGSALRDQWAEINLTRQAAIISAVLDHVVIQPAKRKSNRLDIGRVQPVWRI